MRDARCAMRDARCAMRDARCAMRDARCAMRDARCAARCDGIHYKYAVLSMRVPNSKGSHLHCVIGLLECLL